MSTLEIAELVSIITVWVMGWGALMAILDETEQDLVILGILWGWAWPILMCPWIAYKITKWIIT